MISKQFQDVINAVRNAYTRVQKGAVNKNHYSHIDILGSKELKPYIPDAINNNIVIEDCYVYHLYDNPEQGSLHMNFNGEDDSMFVKNIPSGEYTMILIRKGNSERSTW